MAEKGWETLPIRGIENYELFNRINNMEIMTLIHILPRQQQLQNNIQHYPESSIETMNLQEKEEKEERKDFLLLKKSYVLYLDLDSVDKEGGEIIFPINDFFPFLEKAEFFTINQKKLPRQFIFLFSKEFNELIPENSQKSKPENEEKRDHQILRKTKIIQEFIKLIESLGGRIAFEDYINDDRMLPLNQNENNSDFSPNIDVTTLKNTQEEGIKDFKFTTRIYLLKNPYESFYQKYSQCSDLFLLENYRRKDACTFKNRGSYYASEIVSDFLFLGDYTNGSNKDQLKALGITHLVDVTGHETSRNVCELLGIEYLPINIWDMENVNLLEYVDEVSNFLRKAQGVPGQRALVHCRAGWSRSTSFVLAFLMNSLGFTLSDAYICTVKQRPMICPNDGFRDQLCSYEESLFGKRSVENADVALTLLRKYGLLWTDQTTSVETDFDRIPIQAFKKKINATMYELPSEQQPENMDNHEEKPLKPKKPFLKRGEGKKKPVKVMKEATSKEVPVAEVPIIDVETPTI